MTVGGRLEAFVSTRSGGGNAAAGWRIGAVVGTAAAVAYGGALGFALAYGYDLALLALVGLPLLLVLIALPTDLWVVAAVGAVVLSRTVEMFGAPAALNFAHFPVVVLAAGRAFLLPSRWSPQAKRLALAGAALFLVCMTSAVTNRTGMVRAILFAVVVMEPFLLVFALTRDPPGGDRRRLLAVALVALALLQVPIAVWQSVIYEIGDPVQGTFVGQGAGAHVLGSMVTVAAAFAAAAALIRSRLATLAIVAALLAMNILADAKQVVGIAIAAYAVTGLISRPGRWPRYVIGLVLLLFAVHLTSTVYSPLRLMMQPELLARGVEVKFRAVPLITAEFDQATDWVLGVGPGHTVSRVALMSHHGYGGIDSPLARLGIRGSEVTNLLWYENEISHLSRASSAWSLFFSWVGLWGDTGILGIVTYIALGVVVWRATRSAPARAAMAARWTLIFCGLLGLVFGYLEEPGLTLYAAAWVGLAITSGTGSTERATPVGEERAGRAGE